MKGMKINNKIIVAAVVLMLPLCSCTRSILNSGNVKTGNKATVVGLDNTQVKKPVAVEPGDRENVNPPHKTTTYSPEELEHGAVTGDWAIVTVLGKPAVGGDKAPYLKFAPKEKRVYGNNGCNTYNADYTYNAKDSTLQFTNSLTTMMACDGGVTDIEVNQALNATRFYSWSHDETHYYMTFYDAARKPVMTLMHQNFQFLNGTWRVATVKENDLLTLPKEKAPETPLMMVIDIDEGKVHGNTGCNILNGSIEINMEAPNSISFVNIATTRRMCPPDRNYEDEFVVALEEVVSAHPVDRDSVELLNGGGQVIITLQREH